MATTLPAVPVAAADWRAYRLASIDMVRGVVIVIMALDHVRDFFMAAAQQDPLADPNVPPGLFFTRWITHFCAPVFVLLAGTSAGLMARRRSHAELARFLFTRGVWLLFVELFVISTALTFAPQGIPQVGGTFVAMQVIWAIGASMLVLSIGQRFGRRACLVLGLLIVCGHNLLDPIWPATQGFDGRDWPLWTALHSQISYQAGPFVLLFAYPVLAWIGVMMVGFGVSPVFELPAARRNRLLLRGGAALTAAFVALRASQVYGEPNGWALQSEGTLATLIDFLNTTKYPPSLDFLLMTIGPAAILCALADRLSGPVKEFFVTFGRVPFAFYVPHVYLIHLLSVGLGLVQGFALAQMLTLFSFYPAGYGVSLAGVYVAWALVIALLYPWCRWVGGVKARRRDWWLSYL